MGQNLVPLVNIKIAGKWMFIPLKMVLIGIDPYPYMVIRSDTVGWVDLQRIPTSLIRGTTLCSGHGVSHLYLVSKNWTDWTWLKQATFLGQLGLWDRRNPGLANHVFIIYVYWVYWLVVSTPLKNMSMGRIIPYIMENKKCSKPPTSLYSQCDGHKVKYAPSFNGSIDQTPLPSVGLESQ